MTLADKINLLLLLVACGGLFATLLQIRSGARVQRAEFFQNLYLKLRSDPDISNTYYQIEYEKLDYHELHGSEIESQVDKLLTLVDLVCELRIQNILSKREMEFFDYQIFKIYKNKDIQKYLFFLNNYQQSLGLRRRGFHSFVNYSKKHFDISIMTNK